MPAAAQLGSQNAAGGAVVTTPHVRAELLAQAPQGLTPGATVWLGLQIAHQPEWHTYWKNAGDSGLPTEFRWTLPAGLVAGDIDWPTPHKIPIGNLANYGYENTVLLPVPVQVAENFKPPVPLAGAATVPVKLSASWLVCRKECIPEEGEFTLQLPAQGSTAMHAAEFDRALAARPAALGDKGSASVAVEGQQLQVRVTGLPAAAVGKTLAFFPETGEVIRNGAVAGQDWTQRWSDGVWTATLPLAEQRAASPTTMPIVLALDGDDRRAAEAEGRSVGWRAEAPVSGAWPSTAPRATVSPELQAALDSNAAAAAAVPAQVTSAAFWAALLGALVGGLLLNLMPCVFPVLAIKVLGFARQGDDCKGHRSAALAYTAGVLASFLALGGAMLALRAMGAQLGWGFQLQSPVVVAVLAALFTAIGLNLAGMFEVRMLAPASVCSAQVKHPIANDFLSGVLAVVVASPCTAPFMGASMGLAIGLPAVQALLLFAALGLGLALPYLVAGFVPAVARLLPKPGPWMDTLRRVLAFPMFAVVAWLVWVLGQQSGIDGAAALLGLLVAGAAVVWAFTLRGRTRVVLAALSLAGFAALIAILGPNVVQVAAASPVAARAGERWQPWSTERVAQLHGEGRPVFIDFTAAWCVTCQVNKRTTLTDSAVLADFDRRGVALLRADWTRRDPAITAALGALGRSGVPLYVLAAPGKPPVVLSELLSPADVKAALGGL
ncbi:protein-disulfide reductase [Xenophilus aerolatus]|nr:protein-disulfide reductase [Xenophilus aerolatus]